MGAKSDDYDKRLIKTLVEKAIEKRDPNLLKFLDKTLPGQTYALSDTAGGASAKLEAVDRLTVLARQAQAEAERRQEKADKAAKDTAHRTAIDALAADPSKALPDALLAEGSKYDPEFKIKVLDWQKKLAEGGVAEDPKALAKLYSDIFAGGGMRSVEKALTDGTIRSAQGLKEATAYVKQMEAEGGRGARILDGNTVSTILSTIEKRSPNASPLDPFAAAGPSNAALQAQTEYKRMLLDWAARNPDASQSEMEKARSDIGRLVLSGVQGSGDEATYARPPDAAIKAIGAEPGALPPPPPKPEVQGPPIPPPDPALETFKNSFSPAQRYGLEQKAKERGLDPETVWQEILKQRNQPKATVPQGSFFQPMSYTPGSGSTPSGLNPISYTTGSPTGPSLAPGRRVTFARQDVNSAIATAATASGMDLATLTRFANIESGGDPGNVTGSYKGLFQLSEREFSRYGPPGGDIFDPVDNAMAAAAKLKAEAEAFAEAVGRPATATDLYLIHQQGEGGYAAHLRNPSSPAWENMYSTGEGQQKGERWAKAAIWGNIPTNLRSYFPSGVESVMIAKGWQPYSVLSIGADGKRAYLPFSRFDPVALPIGIVADMVDIYQHPERLEAHKESLTSALVLALAKNITDRTYLQSLQTFFQAVADPEKSMGKFAGRLAGNMVPFSGATRSYGPDPYMHEVRGVVDGIKANTWGLSATLPPKRDAFGTPILVNRGFWSSTKDNIVDNEVIRLGIEAGIGLTAPPPLHKGVDLRDLTLEDGRNAYDAFQELAARPSPGAKSLKDAAARMIASRAYQRMSDGDGSTSGTKGAALRSLLSQYREAAIKSLMKTSPTLRNALLEAQRKAAAAYASGSKPAQSVGDAKRIEGLLSSFGVQMPQGQ